MAWSTLPAVVDKLVAVFTAAVPGMTVLDGPSITATSLHEAVTVGWSAADDATVGESTLDAGSIGITPSREHTTVTCAVHVLRGTTDISAARARAYTIFDDLAQAIAADPKLGDTVMTAIVTGARLSQSQTEQGALVVVEFDVDCDAFTSR